MSTVTRSMKGRKITSFAYQAEGAKVVFLAGSFNDWNSESTPMTRKSSGKWIADLELAPGAYEYRYVVDGDWCNEPECTGHESCPHCGPNPFGLKNQRVQIKR
jgi:1,4-alpha-glucan branching enzyme